jgi:hypothetical protein
MWPWNTRRPRFWGLVLLGAAVALWLLGLVPGWGLAAAISFVGIAVLGLVYLGWLAWAVATGRVGLIRGDPTARRQRRLARRAAARAQAETLVQQQRLDAALSHGPYRPQTPPQASDERARARQELLEAAEEYGGLSPQAQAAADKAKRLRG